MIDRKKDKRVRYVYEQEANIVRKHDGSALAREHLPYYTFRYDDNREILEGFDEDGLRIAKFRWVEKNNSCVDIFKAKNEIKKSLMEERKKAVSEEAKKEIDNIIDTIESEKLEPLQKQKEIQTVIKGINELIALRRHWKKIDDELSGRWKGKIDKPLLYREKDDYDLTSYMDYEKEAMVVNLYDYWTSGSSSSNDIKDQWYFKDISGSRDI